MTAHHMPRPEYVVAESSDEITVKKGTSHAVVFLDTFISAEELVKQGVQLLNDKAPGWQKYIQPGELLMRSGYFCILGQVFGEYGKGVDDLDIQGSDFGFTRLSKSVFDEDGRYLGAVTVEFADLDDAWQAELKKLPSVGTEDRDDSPYNIDPYADDPEDSQE